MINRIPIINSAPITYKDLIRASVCCFDDRAAERFSLALSKFLPSRYNFFTDSGISSFYILLKALKENSGKREIILPAYTAGSLVVATIKAGLKPVLCDISLEDFNLDKDYLLRVVSKDTLAVVMVHLFGIGINDTGRLKNKIPQEVFLIEDCAQALGSRVGDKYVGTFQEVSFFSFNRGKNLPLYGGGCISTTNKEIAAIIEEKIKGLKEGGLFFKLLTPFKNFAFYFAVNPLIYGIGFSFIERFRDIKPPEEFPIEGMSSFQMALGSFAMEKTEEVFLRRYKNGMALINALKGIKGVILPKIAPDSYPAFNRLPVLFEEIKKRELIEIKLWEKGITTSRMYFMPIHHMFNLGYRQEDFPCANYLAERLLTLPVHTFVNEKIIAKMTEVIKEVLK